MGKMTPVLTEKFNELLPDELLDVVLEFDDDAIQALDHADSTDQMREIFAGYSKPVRDKIKLLGGNITGEGWLNGTLQAKLTRQALESLSNEPSVARVDLPHQLQRE